MLFSTNISRNLHCLVNETNCEIFSKMYQKLKKVLKSAMLSSLHKLEDKKSFTIFNFQKQLRRFSIRKGALTNFTKFTGKHLQQSLFFNKKTLSKKRFSHRCFPVNSAKFLRRPFLQNTSGRLLLNFCDLKSCLSETVRLSLIFKFSVPDLKILHSSNVVSPRPCSHDIA